MTDYLRIGSGSSSSRSRACKLEGSQGEKNRRGLARNPTGRLPTGRVFASSTVATSKPSATPKIPRALTSQQRLAHHERAPVRDRALDDRSIAGPHDAAIQPGLTHRRRKEQRAAVEERRARVEPCVADQLHSGGVGARIALEREFAEGGLDARVVGVEHLAEALGPNVIENDVRTTDRHDRRSDDGPQPEPVQYDILGANDANPHGECDVIRRCEQAQLRTFDDERIRVGRRPVDPWWEDDVESLVPVVECGEEHAAQFAEISTLEDDSPSLGWRSGRPTESPVADFAPRSDRQSSAGQESFDGGRDRRRVVHVARAAEKPQGELDGSGVVVVRYTTLHAGRIGPRSTKSDQDPSERRTQVAGTQLGEGGQLPGEIGSVER